MDNLLSEWSLRYGVEGTTLHFDASSQNPVTVYSKWILDLINDDEVVIRVSKLLNYI